jgi:hypothetical protein
MTWHDNSIRPGEGAAGISLFQTRSAVALLIGKASAETKYENEDDKENVTWLEYFGRGFDLCISTSSLVTAISLFRAGVDGHEEFLGTTSTGIGVNSKRSEVIDSYGKPDQSGEPYTNSRGAVSRSWIRYETGIGFEFSLTDDRIDRIAIYPQNKTTRRPRNG